MKSGQIAAWHAEHLNFARLLRLLEEQVACFAQGGEPDYQLMLDIVYYLRHFPDLHHHRYENEVFRRVAEREPGMRPLVSQLLQEHRVIAASGARLYSLIEAAVAGAVLARDDLEAAAATFLAYYRAHLATEEAHMVPRVAGLLSADDWAAVAAAVVHKAKGDPLFGAEAEERFRSLRMAIEREAAAPVKIGV